MGGWEITETMQDALRRVIQHKTGRSVWRSQGFGFVSYMRRTARGFTALLLAWRMNDMIQK